MFRDAESSGAAAGAAADAVVVVAEGAPLAVECALRVEQSAAWRVDEHALQPAHGLRAAGERATGAGAGGTGVVVARLEAPRAHQDHAGRYTCAPDSRGVRVRVLPANAAHAAPAPPSGAPPPVRAGDEPEVKMVEIRKPFALSCDLANPSALPVAWTVNGTALEERQDLQARFAREEGGTRLAVRFFHEDDYGNYTCGVGGTVRAWDVRGVPVARAAHDAAVVEGQKLRLTCRITGKPYPAVTWLYTNDSMNATDALEVYGTRASLQRSEQGVEGGELWLDAAQRGDAGLYLCVPGPDGLAHNATTTVRVKDMYAALWPFLGICLEVFLLCAIILVYEKRRTKPELDDSDTDNHDQKKS